MLKHHSLLRQALFLFGAMTLAITGYSSNTIDTELKKAMQAYHVPAVTYALIDHGAIAKQGAISINPKLSVSKDSMFQAASISKSLTSYAALSLINVGKLKLNAPANHYLKHWTIPSNTYTDTQPVLIKHLMDMTSGLSVSGFLGYSHDKTLPTAIEILNGAKPANNAPITVKSIPGSTYFYSGGAFQALQQVITDVTNIPFDSFMNHDILPALGMNHSLYQYPLNKPYLFKAVPGYTGWLNKEVTHGWRNYACAGAGGMWSTSGDLARFAIHLSNAYLGKETQQLNPILAKQALTRQPNSDFGLGVVVAGSDNNLYFWKAGHNYGYHSLVIMFPKQGKGLAIMTNSETGNIVINYIIAIFAHDYQWPYYFPFFDELIKIPTL